MKMWRSSTETQPENSEARTQIHLTSCSSCLHTYCILDITKHLFCQMRNCLYWGQLWNCHLWHQHLIWVLIDVLAAPLLSSLPVAWEISGRWLKCFSSCTQAGDLMKLLDSVWAWTALIIGTIWEVNQYGTPSLYIYIYIQLFQIIFKDKFVTL